MLPAEVGRHRFEVEEYHRMGEVGIFSEDDRVELLEGKVVEGEGASRPTTLDAAGGYDGAVERVETKISRNLMEAVRERARQEGRDSSEIIEEAVSRYLLRARDAAKRPRDLKEILDSMDRYRRERGVEPLSEEEAMKLAVEEQHAWRRERGSKPDAAEDSR